MDWLIYFQHTLTGLLIFLAVLIIIRVSHKLFIESSYNLKVKGGRYGTRYNSNQS